MSIYFLSIYFYLFNIIECGNITVHSLINSSHSQSNKSLGDVQPIFFDSTNGHLEEQLNEAIYDNDDGKEYLYLKSNESDFEELTYPMSLLLNDNDRMLTSSLDKVDDGNLPSGIIEQEYSVMDKIKLIRLYQSNIIEEKKELFYFIAQHTHRKYINCVSNLKNWIQNPVYGEPIFFRNCVPCTNAVDLNLQSLFNHYIHLNELKHYFVNTCNNEKQWISYISQMEYLPVDLKRHPTTTFTDIIRRNIIPNQRYVIQGLVRIDYQINARESFHVCNLINDEYGHIWIIDGQIERVFDLSQLNDVEELDKRYRPDYISRASTGLFRPTSLIQHSGHSKHEIGSEEAPGQRFHLDNKSDRCSSDCNSLSFDIFFKNCLVNIMMLRGSNGPSIIQVDRLTFDTRIQTKKHSVISNVSPSSTILNFNSSSSISSTKEEIATESPPLFIFSNKIKIIRLTLDDLNQDEEKCYSMGHQPSLISQKETNLCSPVYESIDGRRDSIDII